MVAFQEYNKDIINRLKKLLMMCRNKMIPLQTIDQLKWDLSLPYDYEILLIERHPEWFRFVQHSDGRDGLKLEEWDESLAISQLELHPINTSMENEGVLAFPIRFTRGFGLKKKCSKWLDEWQKLPYTSPYVDASYLDPRTDLSEKRIVGIFHELLHLTIHKKIERKKFTKAFERHPWIFYISRKGDTQTVVLREAYDSGRLIEKHRLVDIREKACKHDEARISKPEQGITQKRSGGRA